jgi:hypothetical protein
MRGTPLIVLGMVGLLIACVTAPPQGSADSGIPAQQGGDSGVQQPPPAQTEGGNGIDGGVPEPPPTTGAGATGGLPPAPDGGILSFDPALLPVPPAPTPDDPAACGRQVLPFPDLFAQPDRPCTEDGSTNDEDGWTVAYRYDATGRLIYRAGHSSYGYDSTYTSEDDGGVRIETLVEQGRLSTRDVTRLQDGNAVEADHFKAGADGGLVLYERSTWLYDGEGRPLESDHFKTGANGGLVLDGHTTWLYDGEGRQQYVISQFTGQARRVERNVYDPTGRPYFVDVTDYWPGATQPANHRFTARSWFANRAPAHEYGTCDIVGGAPCGILEERWEPCGHLAYSGNQTGNGRWSSFTDWSWDDVGSPRARHDRYNTTTDFFNSTETYQVDAAGQVVSGAIFTINPPNYWSLPPTEQHEAAYTYDQAGRLIDRSIDGKTVFHARYDESGRLIELLNGTVTRRWTYNGCGRPESNVR